MSGTEKSGRFIPQFLPAQPRRQFNPSPFGGVTWTQSESQGTQNQGVPTPGWAQGVAIKAPPPLNPTATKVMVTHDLTMAFFPGTSTSSQGTPMPTSGCFRTDLSPEDTSGRTHPQQQTGVGEGDRSSNNRNPDNRSRNTGNEVGDSSLQGHERWEEATGRGEEVAQRRNGRRTGRSYYPGARPDGGTDPAPSKREETQRTAEEATGALATEYWLRRIRQAMDPGSTRDWTTEKALRELAGWMRNEEERRRHHHDHRVRLEVEERVREELQKERERQRTRPREEKAVQTQLTLIGPPVAASASDAYQRC